MAVSSAGSHLMLGCSKVPPDPEFVRFLDESGIVGVIWVGREVGSAERLAEANRLLRASVSHPLLIALDHEGGIVTRLGQGVTIFPGNRALGEARDPGLAFEQGRVMGGDLRRMGVDINLAPVLDLLVSGQPAPGITIRSFGTDVEVVSSLGLAFLQGLESVGVRSCVKHFPGIGGATLDPHFDLPVVDMDVDTLWKKHIEPFRVAIQGGCSSVMTSHVVYSGFTDEGESLPATFSRSIVERVLRDELGFDGPVLSDDLRMGALDGMGTFSDRVIRAVRSGHDLLLVCDDLSRQQEAYRALVQAEEGGVLDRDRASASRRRVQKLFRESVPEFGSSPSSAERLVETIARKAVRVVRDPAGLLPISGATRSRPCVLYPDLRDRPELTPLEMGIRDGSVLDSVSRTDFLLYPTGGEVEMWYEANRDTLDSASMILCFVYDWERADGMDRLLNQRVFSSPAPTVVVLTRHPEDLDRLPEGVAVVQAYGFLRESLLAAWDQVFGEA
ncbi:MAG: glycoside hydrolase family 3 protein [Planctomycetota bacterium]|nr:glycoside hydrolase family 3 protein [Planctomycetota bacterium]